MITRIQRLDQRLGMLFHTYYLNEKMQDRLRSKMFFFNGGSQYVVFRLENASAASV